MMIIIAYIDSSNTFNLDDQGNLPGHVTLDPDDGAKGAVLPVRSDSIATRKSIKMELDHMTDKSIITPVRWLGKPNGCTVKKKW